MVGQSCGHGGRTRGPVAIGHPDAECSYRPAEIVAVSAEVGRSVMDVPVLGETVGLAALASILVARRAVVSFP